MTNSSNARKGRRIALKAHSAAPLLGEAPKAIITLTEVPGTKGGFSIGMGLHGARMEEIDPGQNHPVSIVDVIALAVTHIIRTQPQDFQDSVALVNSTLRTLHTSLENGQSVQEAMTSADIALAGAIGDVNSVATAPANNSEGDTADVG